jgi:hypothetical protein
MIIVDKLYQQLLEALMEPAQQPANNIFHDKDRVILTIGISGGVNLTFSLSDDDLEHLMEQRKEYKRAQKRAQLALPAHIAARN